MIQPRNGRNDHLPLFNIGKEKLSSKGGKKEEWVALQNHRKPQPTVSEPASCSHSTLRTLAMPRHLLCCMDIGFVMTVLGENGEYGTAGTGKLTRRPKPIGQPSM